MSAMVLEKLAASGFDVENTLGRFMGNEALYMKFLKKFLQDGNFEALEKAVGQEAYEEAFISAHTLKGVAGNLGLPFYQDIIELVELLRQKPYDAERIEGLLQKIKTSYRQTVSQIEALE